MKKTDFISVEELAGYRDTLTAGDAITLSGTVYTARDAAHKLIKEALEAGRALPFELKGSAIYYAGPTPERPGTVCGSFGPTTSARMDKFSPQLYDNGVFATIGKGERSEEVIASVVRNGALYLVALGGAGALAAKHITSLEVIAFPELGCEAVRKLTFDKFPLYVGIDTRGGTIFKRK